MYHRPFSIGDRRRPSDRPTVRRYISEA